MGNRSRERFRRLVKREGLEAVSLEIDVCISHVSMISNGKRTPSGEVAARIQRKYNIPAIGWFEAA